ncbi:MAG: GGDEF domain-containing protein [Armatimonadetes bacterium]|nr:GGDEF domain-containing protein [Armatimonadota bacterium]
MASLIDKLSGLYNRDYFMQQLRTEVARCRRYGRPLTLLLLEIQYDFFEYGLDLKWTMGYSLFKQLGPVIKETYRNVDLAARYSGEIFAVSLPETPLEGAAIAGERLRKRVEEHEFLGTAEKERVRIALNIGVATFPDHGQTIDELLETARAGMELARDRGGNIVIVGRADPLQSSARPPAASEGSQESEEASGAAAEGTSPD